MNIRIGNLDVLDRRGDLLERGAYRPRDPDQIDAIVVHHSASPPNTTAEAIARYHVESNGWPGIGYHFLVHADGQIEYVGDLATVRFHVRGHNPRAVGVCLAGDFSQAAPPKPQLEAAARICAEIQFQLGWFVPIYGHRELTADTECPGATWLRTWRQAVICRV